MSIEKQITELTAAIRALTEATVANTAALAGTGANARPVSAPAAVPSPSKSTDKDKDAPAGASAPGAPAATVTQAVTFPTPAEGEPLDYTKHVRPVMTHVISTKGSAIVRTILEGLGVAKATELKAEGLPKFYGALKAQL